MAVLGLIALLTAYVAVPVAGNLRRVEETIDEAGGELGGKELAEARAELQAANDRLDSLSAKILRIVPVVGGNLASTEAVTEALSPVIDTAAELEERARTFKKGGLISGGQIRIDELTSLAGPLADEVVALEQLEIAAADAMNGTTLPSLWERLSDLRDKARELRSTLENVVTLVRRAPKLLGAGSSRRYLVMLVNNAELRGAGGILAGIGTLSFRNGKLSLEKLSSVHDLDVEPRITVPAPPLYERRYGQYQANTTLWLNATFSPDLPDVATVAARLFQKTTGIETSGAIAIDPRGLAALLDDEAKLKLDRLGTVEGEDLPRVIYSEAYDAFTDQEARREAILQLGVAAFESVITDGLPEDGVAEIGEAVAEGHIGFVSFDRVEGQALDAVGASHDLPPVRDDVLMVSVQNFGGGGGEGSKLDYWAKRSVGHSCDLTTDEPSCATTVRIANTAPKGLTTYVAGKPYALLRNYVEVFVPADATLEEVRVDGRTADFRPEPTGDMLSVGVYVEVPRTETTTISVVYSLDDIGEGYELVAIPQPLARDARVKLAIGLPKDWSVSGPGSFSDGRVKLDTEFESRLELSARPAERRGLSALWQKLVEFWNEPLF